MKNYLNNLKKIFSILPLHLNKRLKLIFFLLSIGGLLETLGIGAIIPLISIIFNNESGIKFLGDYLNLETSSKSQTLIYLSGLIFVLYLVKAIFLSFLEFVIQKFTLSVNAEVTTKLFKNYLNKPYKFIFKNNSSILFRNLTSEVSNFCAGIIEPVILAAKEFFIFILIISMLITINYQISLVIISFAIIFFLIVKVFLKKILFDLGKKEQNFKGIVNKIMLEALHGFKFIKSYKIENKFVQNLIKILKEFIQVKHKSTAFRSLPRIWIEPLIIFLLILLGIIFIYTKSTLSEYVIFISIFMISMIKVMPSLISFIKVVNTFHNYQASIDLISDQINQEGELDQFRFEEDKVLVKNFNTINFKEIYFAYDEQKKHIIKDLSLSIKNKNEIIGICGPSGSGKTTLIDIFIGLLLPQKGDIFLDSQKLRLKKLNFELFGYVPQNTFLFDDTIKKNILITSENKSISDKDYQEAIKQSELKNFIDTLTEKDETKLGENGVRISGGQKQRIGIARALVAKPKILILDEATSALDHDIEKNIFKTIKELSKNMSIIVISHNERIWKYCTHLYKLNNGKLERL